MVVTPIREENRVVGVLAAFAPTPHAFTITHVAVLKTMADQISALLQRERRAREEGPRSEEPRPAPPAITAKPVIAAPAPAQAAPPAVVIKPSTSAPRAAAPAMAKVEPIKSVPLEVVPLATPPTKKEEKRADVAPRASFGTFDAMASEEKKPGNRFMMIGVVAVLVIAAGATFAFLKMQKPGAKAPPQTQEAANVPPPVPSSGNTQPGPSNVNAQPATVTPSNAKPAADTETKKSVVKAVSEKTSAPVEKPAPAEKTTSVATLNASGTSRIAQDTSAQPVPEIAPSFNVGGSSSAPLSSLARPVASSTPSAAAIEQSQLEPLQLIKTAQLVYPPIAKARNITGMVVVEVKVGKDGKVSSPRFVSGPPVFKDAAFDAVSRYQFKPAKLNGQPIEQVTQIRLNFH
jgi:protein TonB